MKHLLSPLLVLATMSLTCFAQAQQAKVIKVKGQQAIVQFPAGTPPVVGEMIPVGEGAAVEGGGHVARGSRSTLFGLSSNLSFTNNSNSSNSTTAFNIQARYGWNQEIMEFGPLGQINYSSTTGLTNRTILGGGFFDFNFVANKPGVATVYGVGATVDAGQQAQTIANVDTSWTKFDLFAGGNIKWFGLSDNVALRGDAGFTMSKSSPNGVSSTDSGFLFMGGLYFYF